MDGKVKVFLDTSVLFAAVHSESGGARLIMKLGEAGAVSLWVGPWVLREVDGVLGRKSPKSKGLMALLLDRAGVQVGKEAGEKEVAEALQATGYVPDAQVLAEALAAGADYVVSLNQEHLVGNPKVERLPFRVGTPGDFLARYRERLLESGG